MKIEAIFVYPIKSLRGISLDATALGQRGIEHDRRFMLLRVRRQPDEDDADLDYENLHVSHYPQMCLFATEYYPSHSSPREASHLRVTYQASEDGPESRHSHLVPLRPPNVSSLSGVKIKMHQSETIGRVMEPSSCEWFSERFGFQVVLVYLPGETEGRQVLGNIAPNSIARNAEKRAIQESTLQKKTSYFSWISDMTSYLGHTWGFSNTESQKEDGVRHHDYKLTFADCAPYLVASSKSLDNVRTRGTLNNDEPVDIMRFRPNIVIAGATEAFEEDYWREIRVTNKSRSKQSTDTNTRQEDVTRLLLTANCVRCPSLNVDYETGQASNPVLKSLQRDRRVDKGHKYSPVFGRYAFLSSLENHALETNASCDISDGSANGGAADPKNVISVGDSVEIGARNQEHTTFKWPGLGSTSKENLYPVD